MEPQANIDELVKQYNHLTEELKKLSYLKKEYNETKLKILSYMEKKNIDSVPNNNLILNLKESKTKQKVSVKAIVEEAKKKLGEEVVNGILSSVENNRKIIINKRLKNVK